MVTFHLAQQAVILVDRQVALPLGPGIDDRPRRPRRIVQKRLRPVRGRIVNLQRLRRRLQRRQAIVIVQRVEEPDMANRRQAFQVKPVTPGPDNIVIGHRPAVGPGNHLHPVSAQHMHLARITGIAHAFDIGVAGQQQLRIDRLEKLGLSLGAIRTADQRQQRMRVKAAAVVLQDQGQRGAGLGHQPDTAKAHGVAHEPLPHQAGGVARPPHRTPGAAPRGHPARRTGLLLGRLGRGRFQK